MSLQSDQDTSPSFNPVQLDFIQQICNFIDSELLNNCITDLKLNTEFWKFLLNKLNLASLLNTLNEPYSRVSLHDKQELYLSLKKLIICLIRIDSELSKLLPEDLQFSFEFTLNFTFLIYEQVDRILATNRMVTVFEIDLSLNVTNDPSLKAFENCLIYILNQSVLNNLPELVQSQFGSGKAVLEVFKGIFNTDNVAWDMGDTIVDVDMFMYKPELISDQVEFTQCNPISQSYKCLVNNLNSLNLYCNDPCNEPDEDSDLFGRMNDQTKSFSHFTALYYTMGLFELKKFLFESPLQYLYELKQFNTEFNHVFRNDTILYEWKMRMIDSLQCSYEEFFRLFESNFKYKIKSSSKPSTSKWRVNTSSLTLTSSPSTSTSPIKHCLSQCDQIMQRIQTLNTTVLFDSYLSEIDNEYYDHTEGYTRQGRGWTVAPKLFPTNTTSGINKQKQSEASNLMVNKNTWSRSEPKPIGSKPASMFTISNQLNNRHRSSNSNKYIYVNNSQLKGLTQPRVTISTHFTNIWKQAKCEQMSYSFSSISPYVTYESYNLSNLSKIKPEPTCVSVSKLDLSKRTNFMNSSTSRATPHDKARCKKYSVAPLGLLSKNVFKTTSTPSSIGDVPFKPVPRGYQHRPSRNVYSYEGSRRF